MRPKSHLQTLSLLLNKPSFSAREAQALGISSAVLAYYVNTGKIKRIGRGIYQEAGKDNPFSTRWGDLAEVVFSIPSGVVCLISALAIYDLTEELPRQHWIGIRHGTSARSNRQSKIIRFRNLELGKTEIHDDVKKVLNS